MRLDGKRLESLLGIRIGSPAAYLVAAVVAVCAILVRLEMDDYLTSAQFITYYPAILLTALFCGGGPGVFAAVLCGLASWFLILSPRGSWEVSATPEIIALTLYLVLAPVGAVAIAALRRAITQLREAERRQAILIGELQHRTRNLLAVVGGMSHQLLRSSASLADFGRSFDQRLSALGRVQGLLSRGDEAVDFEELIGIELAAHNADPAGTRVRLAGPPLSLPSRTAQPAALAIHELATNAMKHGALAQPSGRLAVSWTVAGSSQFPVAEIVWQESGVRLSDDAAERPSGFGRQLLEKALPYDLGTRTSFSFTGDGIRYCLELPLNAA
jgi:two-component sensor histidine kinase